MKTREIRARASIERRAMSDDEKKAGYIGAVEGEIPFKSDSQKLTKRGRPRPFVERLHPDVFKRSLNEDKDIMLNAGHTEDPLSSIARIGENLTITTSDKSLHYRALVPDTDAGRDLLTLIDKRVIRGTSFEFEIRGESGEKWEKRDDNLDERTILEARLLALNPVIWPAYADTSLTVELRRRQKACDENESEDRGTYYRIDGIYDYYDPTITGDAKFAVSALSRETYALTDALEYLRALPAGAMADYAKAEVASAAANVATLSAWLADNGATINPALQQRAAEKLAEARQASPEISDADHDRERRFRILQLDSR